MPKWALLKWSLKGQPKGQSLVVFFPLSVQGGIWADMEHSPTTSPSFALVFCSDVLMKAFSYGKRNKNFSMISVLK